MNLFNLFGRSASNSMSSEQLKKMMDSSNPPILIDVRTPQEYSTGHIPNSQNIPVQIFEDMLKKSNLDLSKPVVVYCQSGMRSSHASKILSRLGCREVYDFGGINRWEYGFSR